MLFFLPNILVFFSHITILTKFIICVYICIEQNLTIKRRIEKHVTSHIMRVVNKFFDATDGGQSTLRWKRCTNMQIHKVMQHSPIIWYHNFHMKYKTIYHSILTQIAVLASQLDCVTHKFQGHPATTKEDVNEQNSRTIINIFNNITLFYNIIWYIYNVLVSYFFRSLSILTWTVELRLTWQCVALFSYQFLQ